MSRTRPEQAASSPEPTRSSMIARPVDGSLLSIMRFAETMANTLQDFYEALESTVVDDFEAMGQDIASMRGEINRLQADELASSTLPAVAEELEGIREIATDSANAILQNAEAALRAERTDMDSYAGEVAMHMTRIIEACAFQDIAGQRLERVNDLLSDVRGRLERFASAVGTDENVVPLSAEAAAREKKRAARMLHGPQSKSSATRQHEIDDILDSLG